MKNKLYTSVSKGGEYELVGTSHGAGKLKGFPLMIYRDTKTGAMFHREPEEFATRMKAIEPKADAAELLDALLTALPYVECAQSDPMYKPGAVAKVVAQMKAVIAKAGA